MNDDRQLMSLSDLFNKSTRETLDDVELYELGRNLAHLVSRGKEHRFLRGFAHECADIGTSDVNEVIGDALDVLQDKYSHLDDDREDPDSLGYDRVDGLADDETWSDSDELESSKSLSRSYAEEFEAERT